MQSSSDLLELSILYILTALSNPTGKVIEPFFSEFPYTRLPPFFYADHMDLHTSKQGIINQYFSEKPLTTPFLSRKNMSIIDIDTLS